MLTIIRYILLTALRDKFFLGLAVALLLAVGISSILGGTAMVEKNAMILTFSAGSSRVILMIGLIIFVCFHVRQAFEQKEIDVLISRPISRFSILFSHWLGFSLVALLLSICAILIISFLPIIDHTGYLYWSFNLVLEALLMVALALFASFTLKSAVSSVLATMSFYVLGRMLGFFLAATDSKLLFTSPWLDQGLQFIIQSVAIVMPRLDLFTQSNWLVYGVIRPEDIQLTLIQAVIYIPLALLAATIDFQKREF
jgi:ABC-type transport system involved in multi-copper enzyme maturation permease subunit